MPAGGIKIVSEANLSSLKKNLKSGDDLITQPQVSFLDEKLCNNLNNFTMAKRTYVSSESGWVGGVTDMPMVTMASVQTTPIPYRHAPQIPETKPSVSGSGGRRVKEEFLLDPEEMEKRRIRRERNKLAAARCRKRRVDQIESLQNEVDEWEERKRLLQEEIASLQQQKNDFQFILDAHKSVCKQENSQNSIGAVVTPPTISGPKVVVKSEPELDSGFSCNNVLTSDGMENFPMHSPAMNVSLKPQRPVSLSLKTIPLRSIEGVSIDTPTACLNFDSLIDGRTGLTPTNILTPININVSGNNGGMMTTLTPSCGKNFQQRHQNISISAHCAVMSELSSPTTNSPNLVSL